MSERKNSTILIVAIVLVAIFIIQFNLFLTWGFEVNEYIMAEEEIDTGAMIFFLFAFIELVLLGVTSILLLVCILGDQAKQGLEKAVTILAIVIIGIFLFEVVMGFFSLLDLL